MTANIGLNTSFFSGGKWMDSTQGEWKIEEKKNKLLMMVSFRGMPISQEWLLKIHGLSMEWEVVTRFDDDVLVAQQKQGFIFPDAYRKYEAHNIAADFPPARHEWTEAGVLNSSKVRLIAGAHLPGIDVWQRRPKRYVQFQNLPAVFFSRIINFCHYDPVSFSKGHVKNHFLKKGDVHKNNLKITVVPGDRFWSLDFFRNSICRPKSFG